MERNRLIQKTGWITVAVNALLSGAKLFAGFFAHSGAMISDAVHSLSDVASTFVVMIGASIADRADDEDHNYGHERFESIAALILGGMLLIVAVLIGWDGVTKIGAALRGELQPPGLLAAAAAVVSIAVKEWMYHYTLRIAKKTGSTALKADAWHHRSDAFSSIGALAGIIGARFGLAVLDPIAAIVIALFIIKVAVDISRDGISQLTDRAADPDTREQIMTVIGDIPGVIRIDLLKTRLHSNKLYIDAEISADSEITLDASHLIAQNVHDAVEKGIPEVKHCMVHVNPYH